MERKSRRIRKRSNRLEERKEVIIREMTRQRRENGARKKRMKSLQSTKCPQKLFC